MTDDGGPFRSFHFEAFIEMHPELRHVRTRVKTPGQNGSRERGFGTWDYERLYLDQIDDAVTLAQRAEDYRLEYSQVRPPMPSPPTGPRRCTSAWQPHDPHIPNRRNPANYLTQDRPTREQTRC